MFGIHLALTFVLPSEAQHTHQTREERSFFNELENGKEHAFSLCELGEIMEQREHRDWRIICEEVVQEKDSVRLNALLEELLEALEERERERKQGQGNMSKAAK